MSNDTFFSIQYDSDGNEVEPSENPSIESAEQFNSKENGGAPVSINANAHRFSLQQGADAAEAEQLDNAQRKIDALSEDVLRYEAVYDRDGALPKDIVDDIHGRQTDVWIAWSDRAGQDINDPAVVELRERIARISKRK